MAMPLLFQSELENVVIGGVQDMATNMRRMACELNEFEPQLYINSRKNEMITAIASVEDIPKEYKNNILYMIHASALRHPIEFDSPINLLCICDSEMTDPLTSCMMLNLIVIKHPVNLSFIYERIEHIILTCSDEGYVPQKLLDAACSGDLQNIADMACCLLGNPIIIYDLSFKILAFSKNLNPECPIFKKVAQDKQMIEKTMIAFFEVNALDTLREKRAPYFFECSDKPVLPDKTIVMHAPIIISGMLIGYAVVMKGHVEWDESDLILTYKICKIIALEMKNNNFYKNSKGILHEHFLVDMLESSTEKKEFIEARVRALDLKMNHNMHMVVIRLLNQMNLKLQLNSIVKELKNIFENSVATVYKEHIVLLIHHNHPNQVLSATEQEKLNSYLNSFEMVAGFSICFHDPCHIKRYYQQAMDALDIGLSLGKSGKIFFFQQLSIYRLFTLSSTSTEVVDYFHPSIFCLIDYDRENGTEFMKTLYYYIINLKALLKTKDILHIHRNTLVYRIHKIQEIMNINLDESETFFQLYITFKGLEYIECQKNRKFGYS